MRTTVTLDPDVEALVRQAMRDRGQGFKETVNAALRAGLSPPAEHGGFTQRTFALGFRPEVPYEKALRLAAALEDQELLHELALGK